MDGRRRLSQRYDHREEVTSPQNMKRVPIQGRNTLIPKNQNDGGSWLALFAQERLVSTSSDWPASHTADVPCVRVPVYISSAGRYSDRKTRRCLFRSSLIHQLLKCLCRDSRSQFLSKCAARSYPLLIGRNLFILGAMAFSGQP
jgi:hypothetical protein